MSAQCSFAIRGHPSPFHRNVIHGADFNLKDATIQDFLEDVAEYHETHCGCLVNIGSHVWISAVPLDEAAIRNEPPAAEGALSLQTRLDSLRSSHPSNLNLLIDGVALEFGTNEFLRLAREKRFLPCTHGAGTVYRRYGSKATLPSYNVPSYNSLCTTPGLVFVDKSAFVRSLLVKFSSRRVNFLRRPRGFGKTTFLSMVDAYFDPQSFHAHFPFIFQPHLVSDSLFAARGQMLVFSVDFAKLHLHDGPLEDDMHDADDVGYEGVNTYMTDEELDAKCHAFLDDAARDFYIRYERILHECMEAEKRGAIVPSLRDILRWSNQESYSLVFLIDNYTAPLLPDPDERIQRAISRTIFHRFSDLAKGSLISYGFLVGEDIPGAQEWIGMPSTWNDLSNSPEFSGAIGFTHSEVIALGQALAVDLLPALKSSLPIDQRNDTRLLYAAADVLTIARPMLSAGLPSATPVSVRTLAPLIVEEVPHNISVVDSGTWPDPLEEEDVDMHMEFPDDDDDEDDDEDAPRELSSADNSFELQPDLTLDRGSSPGSSAGSSGGGASAEMKKPFVILDRLESPWRVYSQKKP